MTPQPVQVVSCVKKTASGTNDISFAPNKTCCRETECCSRRTKPRPASKIQKRQILFRWRRREMTDGTKIRGIWASTMMRNVAQSELSQEKLRPVLHF